MKTQNIINTIKSTLLLLLLVGLPSTATYAYAQPNLQDQIEQLRAAFIANYLELTTDEGEIFFPLYNEYKAEKRTLQVQYRETDDAEIKMDIEQQNLDLKKGYMLKFKDALSAEKLNKLGEAELEFKKMLLEKTQNPSNPNQ